MELFGATFILKLIPRFIENIYNFQGVEIDFRSVKSHTLKVKNTCFRNNNHVPLLDIEIDLNHRNHLIFYYRKYFDSDCINLSAKEYHKYLEYLKTWLISKLLLL